MEVSGQLNAPFALSSGNESPGRIRWEIGWTSETVWTLWRRWKSLASVGNQTPAVQPVVIPTELRESGKIPTDRRTNGWESDSRNLQGYSSKETNPYLVQEPSSVSSVSRIITVQPRQPTLTEAMFGSDYRIFRISAFKQKHWIFSKIIYRKRLYIQLSLCLTN
jgi:hypothetical protein